LACFRVAVDGCDDLDAPIAAVESVCKLMS
jgi:hypothetical protein